MKVRQLNHVAIHVADVDRSSEFYGEVLGLAPIPRPAFDFPGAWFRIGVDQELHLIGRFPENNTPPRERHFALMIDSMPSAEERLRARDVSYRGPQRRPDGAWQIFLRDPDQHVIELCTPPSSE